MESPNGHHLLRLLLCQISEYPTRYPGKIHCQAPKPQNPLHNKNIHLAYEFYPTAILVTVIKKAPIRGLCALITLTLLNGIFYP